MGKGPLTTDATDATNTMDAVAPEVLAGRVHPRLMTQLRSLEGISAAESTKSASSTTATKDNAKQEEYALVYILGEKQPLRIPKAAAYKICSTNEKGEALKALEAGRSQVAKVGNVFYKVGDNDIPTEIAVYTFMQILTSQLKLSEHAKKATPDVALIFVKLDGKTIPVQVTEAIDGYSLEDVVRLVPMINHMSQCFTPDLGDGSTTEDEQESNISDPECDISDDSINSSDNGDIKTIDKKILEQIHELYTTHNSKAVTAVTEEEQKKQRTEQETAYNNLIELAINGSLSIKDFKGYAERNKNEQQKDREDFKSAIGMKNMPLMLAIATDKHLKKIFNDKPIMDVRHYPRLIDLMTNLFPGENISWEQRITNCHNICSKFDAESFSLHMFKTLAVKPGDEKGDNVRLMVQRETPDGPVNKFSFCSIDNDDAFNPQPIDDFTHHVSDETCFFINKIKSNLLCMTEHMQMKISDNILQSLEHIDPQKIVMQWLIAMRSLNYNIKQLIQDGVIFPALSDSIHAPFIAGDEQAAELLSKLHKLKKNAVSTCSHEELLVKCDETFRLVLDVHKHFGTDKDNKTLDAHSAIIEMYGRSLKEPIVATTAQIELLNKLKKEKAERLAKKDNLETLIEDFAKAKELTLSRQVDIFVSLSQAPLEINLEQVNLTNQLIQKIFAKLSNREQQKNFANILLQATKVTLDDKSLRENNLPVNDDSKYEIIKQYIESKNNTESENISCLQLLLDLGWDANMRHSNRAKNQSLLDIAITYKSPEAVELLLTAGAYPDNHPYPHSYMANELRDKQLDSPLYNLIRACKSEPQNLQNLKMLEQLLEAGAHYFDASNYDDIKSFIKTVPNKYQKCKKLLIQNNANLAMRLGMANYINSSETMAFGNNDSYAEHADVLRSTMPAASIMSMTAAEPIELQQKVESKKAESKQNQALCADGKIVDINDHLKRQLFDGDKPKQKDPEAFGTRAVIKVDTPINNIANASGNNSHHVYCKIKPEFPGIDILLFEFERALFGENVSLPQSMLAKMRYGDNNEKVTAVRISQGIEGRNLTRVLEDPNARDELNKLDPTLLSTIILRSMLTMPFDGKADNYIMQAFEINGETRYKLVEIDSDRALGEEHESVENVDNKNDSMFGSVANRVSGMFGQSNNADAVAMSALFCLDQMQKPIDTTLANHLLSLDIDAVLTSWLDNAEQRRNELVKLFNETDKEILKKDNVFVDILLTAGKATELREKLSTIKKEIAESFKAGTSLPTLMQLLDAVNPHMADKYKLSFHRANTPLKRFDFVTKGQYERPEESILDKVVNEFNHNFVKAKEPLDQAPAREYRSTISTDRLIASKSCPHNPNRNLQKLLTPAEAKKELTEKSKRNTELQGIYDDLLDGNSSKVNEAYNKFNKLEYQQKKRLFSLQDNVVELAGKESARLEKFYTALGSVYFKSLTIKNAAKDILNTSHLKQILQKIGAKLQSLTIDSCEGFDDECLRAIYKYCPNLKSLSLRNLTSLKQCNINEESLPELTALEISNCINVEAINVQQKHKHFKKLYDDEKRQEIKCEVLSQNLKKLKLNNLPALQAAGCFIYGAKLVEAELRDVSGLNEKLLNNWLSDAILKKLVVERCSCNSSNLLSANKQCFDRLISANNKLTINNLKSIDLQGLQLTDGMLHFLLQKLVDNPDISSYESLEVLDLSNNYLTDAGFEKLQPILVNFKKLKLLKLNNNLLTCASTSKLCSLIAKVGEDVESKSKTNSESDATAKTEANINIQVEGNYFSGIADKLFQQAVALRNKDYKRKEIQRVNNKQADNKKQADRIAITSEAEHKVQIRINEIHLRDGTVTQHYFAALNEMLAKANTISELAIENIGPQLNQVLPGIGKNKNIVSLKLSNNSLEGDQLAPLCEALQNNKSVERLDLSYNSIGSRGAESLAKLLENNHTIKDLILNECELDSISVGVIASGLKNNKGITTIEIQGNESMGEYGYKSLRKLLSDDNGDDVNDTIRTIEMPPVSTDEGTGNEQRAIQDKLDFRKLSHSQSNVQPKALSNVTRKEREVVDNAGATTSSAGNNRNSFFAVGSSQPSLPTSPSSQPIALPAASVFNTQDKQHQNQNQKQQLHQQHQADHQRPGPEAPQSLVAAH